MPRLQSLYTAVVLDRPRLCLAFLGIVTGLLALQTPEFSLDATSDSLLLESDSGIQYYREVRKRYGSDDFLVLTYMPDGDLFSDTVLARLQALRDELAAVPQVSSVVSILDVPLLHSPRFEPGQLAKGAPTLLSERTDRELARKELRESPLYSDRLMSGDGRTTALQINLHDKAQVARGSVVATVREIVERYRDKAEMHLGGLPMINADMIHFIRHDLVVFGVGLAVALIALLALIFRRMRWVLLPLSCCAATVVCMIGVLALAGRPVTVVSSNFISLMLILTLSLNVHLVVRYRELHEAKPGSRARELVSGMVRSKAGPALYTVLTTMVAFASLLASDIRPVIDFGWMMIIGMAIAFALTFVWLPAVLMLLPAGEPPTLSRFTDRITGAFRRLIQRFPGRTIALYAVLAIAAAVNLSQLSIDNRFIDYFKDSTEIYQGMKAIDTRLGGTTPLDIVLDADPDALQSSSEDDELDLPGEPGLAARSYWYDASRLTTVSALHDYLESQADIGKVLSLATTVEVLRRFLDQEKLENFELSIIYRRMPDEVRAALIEPYLSADGNQTRLAARVFETSDKLQRNELLQSIRSHLTDEMGIAPERVHLTGLMVLYNNVLQSLVRSQLVTVGVVTIAVLLMFVVSFRSIAVAAVAIVPNIVGAVLVLGLMSALGIPLDIMTVSIAAIAIGIGVDNTIHYVYRFQEEFARDGDYAAAIRHCHRNVGRAMYYTSITIILGFAILAFSSFVPTIYFGLLTGLAMAVTLIANLTLLPLLLSRLRVLGEAA